MISILGQATSAVTDQQVGGAVLGGGAIAIIVKVAGDIIKEWWKGRTKLGKKLQNGAACPMTKEANDVIVEKDGEGNYMTHFKLAEISRQHKRQDESNKDRHDKHDIHLEKLSSNLIELAAIIKSMQK